MMNFQALLLLSMPKLLSNMPKTKVTWPFLELKRVKFTSTFPILGLRKIMVNDVKLRSV